MAVHYKENRLNGITANYIKIPKLVDGSRVAAADKINSIWNRV